MQKSLHGISAAQFDGGVLRAPMKYVGTKTYNINGTDNTPAGGNAAPADGSDKPAEAGANANAAVKRVRKAAPAAAADGAKGE